MGYGVWDDVWKEFRLGRWCACVIYHLLEYAVDNRMYVVCITTVKSMSSLGCALSSGVEWTTVGKCLMKINTYNIVKLSSIFNLQPMRDSYSRWLFQILCFNYKIGITIEAYYYK
jgi:hypothetical protein